MPRADRVDQAPGQVDHQEPDQEIQGRGPVCALADDTVPGGEARFGILAGQVLDRLGDTTKTFQKMHGEEQGGTGEQQEHQGVGQDYPPGAGVQRKRRVTQPGHEDALDVAQRGEFCNQQGRALGYHQQITPQAQNDGQSGQPLYAAVVKAFPEESRHRGGLTAPQVGTEKQGPVDVAGDRESRQQQVGSQLSGVGESRFPHEHRGAHQAGYQRADDEQRGCPAPRNKVVIQVPYPPTGEISHGDEQHDAGDNGQGKETHCRTHRVNARH